MYNPAGEAPEFIELANTSGQPVDMSGIHFGSGVDFTVPVGTTVPAGGFFLITDFENGTALANGGETLTLLAADGSLIESFRYDDEAPWPESPDGGGPSLTRILPPQTADDPASWRPSVASGGSPGTRDSMDFAGGEPGADDDRDGLTALIEHAHGTSDAIPDAPESLFRLAADGVLSLQRNLAADDVLWSFEQSADLEIWTPSGTDLVFLGSTDNGDGTAQLRFANSGEPGQVRFWRARVTLR